MIYTYSIENDFLNRQVALDRLIEEIQSSTIKDLFNHIIVKNNNCELYFELELLQEQKDILDAIIANHSGETLEPEEEVSKVKIQEVEESKIKTNGQFQASMIDIEVPAITGWTQ